MTTSQSTNPDTGARTLKSVHIEFDAAGWDIPVDDWRTHLAFALTNDLRCVCAELKENDVEWEDDED